MTVGELQEELDRLIEYHDSIQDFRVAGALRNVRRQTNELNGVAASRDRLMTCEEAAQRLAVDVRWIYDNAEIVPFVKRLGRRTMRISELSLERWIATR